MKILVAGASGAIGRKLVPMLVEEGHEVIAVSRSGTASRGFEAIGAKTAALDAFDREAAFALLREHRPDAVIHQLTSLGKRDFEEHARLRRDGTRNLVDASRAAGVDRMIAQSISWAYAPGVGPATEDEPLDLDSDDPRRMTVEAVNALENAVFGMPSAVVLRYGLFYGPGTWYAPDGYMAAQARLGQLTATKGVSSFVHIEDAATASVDALQWPSGHYNVTDGEPAAGTDWLPAFAEAVGAPAPERFLEGEPWERGADHGRALGQGWRPRYSSWRQGFRSGLV